MRPRDRDRKHVVPVLRALGRGPLDPLPLALAGHEEGVHDLRVAARRLRAALPLLARRPSRPRVRNVVALLRRLGDVAGDARDYDVMWGLLAAGPRSTATAGASTPLLDRLRVRRARARRLLAENLQALDLHAVQGAIGSVAAEEPEVLFVVLVRLGQRRDALARDIQARLKRARHFRPAGLHRLRIRIRRLRYLAEVFAEIRGLRPSPGGLKVLQDALGAMQDAWVLSRWLRREAALARRRRDLVSAALFARQAERWTGLARTHHARFLALDADALIRGAVAGLGGRKNHGNAASIGSSRDVPVTP
jgi:triphosphatase